MDVDKVEISKIDTKKKYLSKITSLSIIYVVSQILLFTIPIKPPDDYYNHINWGKAFLDGLYPYRDYAGNEYPVLSAWGWVLAYIISPSKSYFWLSVIMNLPYWILTIFGAFCLFELLLIYGHEQESSFRITTFYLFFPLNFIDTLNNHGSLGVVGTVFISLYYFEKRQILKSSLFLAAGISLKIFPIFITPFMLSALKDNKSRLWFGMKLFTWLLIFHIPVIFIIPAYLHVLFWRVGNKGGVSFGASLDVIGSFIGIDQLGSYIWFFAIICTTGILYFEDRLHLLQKYAIILMSNNLFEPRGGVGHIVNVLPILAIPFLFNTTKKINKWFVAYLGYLLFYGSDLFILSLRTSAFIVDGIMTGTMLITTSIMFYYYLKEIKREGLISLRIISRLKFIKISLFSTGNEESRNSLGEFSYD